MSIEALLTATRDRLATIRHDAPLIDAAKQLSRAKINLVVVCNDDETLSGVITKTDLVRQIGGSPMSARHRLPLIDPKQPRRASSAYLYVPGMQSEGAKVKAC